MANTAPEINLTIHHRGEPHPITLPSEATLQDLSTILASTFNIPPETQKLLIAPKPGMQKAPFSPTPLLQLLSLPSPKLKITLLGTPAQEITTLHTQGAETRRRDEHRTAAQAEARAQHRSENRRAGGNSIRTLSSSSDNYTFHRLEPLAHLPNPSRSLTFLTRLRDDPGIRSAMAIHKFSVPLLTEMDPAEHTTSESRTLGLNRNKGEVIELRLRTDAYDGYRDYRTIRKTLCHELAHCVFSEHDRDFWDLTKRIEGEVEKGDWKSGGRQVGEGEFYNPGDWEVEAEGGHVHDERGWVGSSQVLGGASIRSQSGGRGGGMREVMARAAEERARRAREEKRDRSS
ncbi:WLM domain-containing protein [Aspergillus crustosus]